MPSRTARITLAWEEESDRVELRVDVARGLEGVSADAASVEDVVGVNVEYGRYFLATARVCCQ